MLGLLIIVLLIIPGLATGYFRLLRISQLTQNRLKITALVASSGLAILAMLYWLNILPKFYARFSTVGFYVLAAGFFLGSTIKIAMRQHQSGSLEYINSMPFPVIFPKVLSTLIILFGLYRTQLFAELPSTAIGMSSGSSLIAFGCYGWVIQMVPAFRNKGIIILDTCISWQEVLSFSWKDENLLQIEYYDEQNTINELQTIIPEQDQSKVTTIIENHILERTLE